MEEEVKQFMWVMDACKKAGMEWFYWSWQKFGLRLVCHFGIPSRDIHSGLVLRNDGDILEDTPDNHKLIDGYLERIIKTVL